MRRTYSRGGSETPATVRLPGVYPYPPFPAVISTVEILRKRGHNVVCHYTARGNWRYEVDGRPLMDAHTMSKRFGIV